MILDQTEESASLDFKKTLDFSKRAGEKGSNATKQDIVRDVAAFANGVGGTIIVGVSEEGNPHHATGWGHVRPDEASRIEEVVEASCGQCIDPKVVGLTVHRDKVEETALVIITIPKGRELHGVQLDRGLEFWVRLDKTKRAMTRLEIRNAELASHEGTQGPAVPPPGYVVIAGALNETLDPPGKRPLFFMAISPLSPQPGAWDTQSPKFKELLREGAGQDKPETLATDIMQYVRPNDGGLAYASPDVDLRIRDDGVVTWRLFLSAGPGQMLTTLPGDSTLAFIPTDLEGYPLSLLRLYYRIALKQQQPSTLCVQLCLANIETIRLFRMGGYPPPHTGKAALDEENGVGFYRQPLLLVPKKDPLRFDESVSPDQVAFALVRGVYSAFGHDEEDIPHWNAREGRFVFPPFE
jgi:hypothetical protein